MASTATKPMAQIPEAMKQTHTWGDEKGAVLPHHSSARNNGTMQHVNRMVPSGSQLLSFSRKGSLFPLGQNGTANHTNVRETTPMAKLRRQLLTHRMELLGTHAS